MYELNKCPFCGGTERACIEASGGEWVSLLIVAYGRVSPMVCLDCGLVFVDKDVCERIKKRRAEYGK